MPILILGDSDDLHYSQVRDLLVSYGGDVLEWGAYETFGQPSLSISSNSAPAFQLGNRRLGPNSITAMYNRLKPVFFAEPSHTWEYVSRERKMLVSAIRLLMTPDCRCVNDFYSQVIAENKALQLDFARRVGLAIPPTLITNDPEEAMNFCQGQRSIFKALTWLGQPDGRSLLTTLIEPDDIQQNPEELKAAPCIFQHYIEKDHELRVTCVGRQLFPAKIVSQESADTLVDWRKSIQDCKFDRVELPTDIKRRLLALVESMKLNFAAIDMIVDTNGSYLFLELNPQGNWLWLEQMLDLPISKSIADLLRGFAP
ncbi:MAG: hypothetical protein SWK90_10870 [Chloroflexota bacterium]|nr:hypothetical protein [Chloroflexota bacterium]